MLYQKLLPASAPYAIYLPAKQGQFPIHRHYEIELIYSPNNSKIKVDLENETMILDNNKLMIIGSLVPHGTDNSELGGEMMALELGPVFLKEHFSALSVLDLRDPIIDLSKDDAVTEDLKKCLDEIQRLHGSPDEADQLYILGNIYRICADLIKIKATKSTRQEKRSQRILEQVLKHIHINYGGKITLDDTCAMVGYSKGNFCKVFKEATGLSFHAYLNNYRISNALFLLRDTDMPIGEISSTVGFSEFKTFCRVFKDTVGMTPSEFRAT